MDEKSCIFKWKNQPRIITYTNPKKLKDNLELSMLMKTCVQLCASDTLMQGLIARYGRDSFGVLSSVDNFQELLFNYELTGAKQELQMYLNVKKCIQEIDENEPTKSIDAKNAFEQNVGKVTDAFRFLAMSDYQFEDGLSSLNDEQRIFYENIYVKLIEEYRKKYIQICCSITKKKISETCSRVLINEIERFIYSDSKEKIRTVNDAKIQLGKVIESPLGVKRYKKSLEELIDSIEFTEINTILIHGVIRFTPEIMRLIEALDNCGIKVIFVINYCSNLEEIYGIWKRAYAWTGCPFEYVKALNLAEGREAGRAIAEITLGKRVKTRDTAKIKKYVSLTEFTDIEVRHKFLEAQERNQEHPLADMKVQYYSVDSEKPNDVLRNYFPEQFLEKPFMAYPVGQFIRGLFEMWDFEMGELCPDYTYLKDCSLIKIAHSRDDMFYVLSKVEVYYKDISNLQAFLERSDNLMNKLMHKDKMSEADEYLSYFDVTYEQIIALKEFVKELNQIGLSIFGTDSMKQVDYQKKFGQLIHDISKRVSENESDNVKEKQLLSMLEESLKLYSDSPVIGGVKSLKDALILYLQVRQNRSEARWIVRGFDQLDGAPLMRNPKVESYEIAGLSMKSMTRTINEFLPWPLKDNLFHDVKNQNLYSYQAKTIIDDRNKYLRFYLFYVAFFSEKDLIFSYIENENDVKQRPYYLLSMLGLVPVDVLATDSKEKLVVKDENSKFSSTNSVSSRERNIFSICAYKYFLFAVLGKKITYHSDYHIKYLIENEATRIVSKEANYKQEGMDIIIERTMENIHKRFPYYDDAEMSDIRKYIMKHFLQSPESLDYIQKKRDFLIAQWRDGETKFMNFTKGVSDVRHYLNTSRVMPPVDLMPHKKICQECCFSRFCLNNYYDKEVDV